EIVESIMNDISELESKLEDINSKICNERLFIDESKTKMNNFKSILLELDIVIKLISDMNTLKNNKYDLSSRFNTIKSSITDIKSCLVNIDNTNNRISNIEDEINPIIMDRDKLKHSISLLDEYHSELETYRSKYSTVEIIKKYSSPSKGIQNLFMTLYMNKTITTANQLLSLLFNGEYTLGEFIINENEFRIPCIGSGLPNDDISSMSTSQICMISMILSFALLHQSSSKYNILKLDEIDGGLDTTNRLQFICVLDKLTDMLNVEQTILITHNNEMNLSNCDIIQLRTSNYTSIDGNVIYKY
ncbi:MAG: hypothetical protein ACRCXT_18225, partial [Paraclostridium sp.]